MRALVVFGAVLLGGCSVLNPKPTRTQYAELLHQCRDANREHIRMLKEYEKMKCESHPEQGAGSVESDLGGY